MYTESETVELKQVLTKDVKKEIVALANTKGGTIYIGIADDGNIIGLDNPNRDVEVISGMIREGIVGDMVPYSSIDIKTIDEKQVIEIHIMAGPDKPYYIAEKGLKPSGVYVRLGTASVNASDDAIRAMIVNSRNISFEENVCRNQDLTFEYAKEVFVEHGVEFDERKYQALQLLTNDRFNNLALLISDQNPYQIKAAVFQGNNKVLFKDRKILTGSCIKQVDEAFKYLDFVNRVKTLTFEGLVRKDRKDYPDSCLREIVLNAVIHRDYNFNGAILLSVF